MTRHLERSRTVLPPLVFGTIFAAACILQLLLPSDGGRFSGWKGYYTIVVDDGVDDASLTQTLLNGGFPGAITADSARVEFNDISGMDTVAVSQIEKRFDPLDPRIDPYMQRIGEYFSTNLDGRTMHIAYLPITVPGTFGALLTTERLHRQLDALHVRWRLVEWNLGERLVFLAAFLCISFALVLRTRGHRRLLIVSALPWTLWVFAGGYAAFASSCVLYFAWAFALEGAIPAWYSITRYGFSARGLDTRDLSIRLLFGGFALLIAVALQLSTQSLGESMLPLLAACGATFVATIRYLFGMGRRQRESDHPAFVPVRILKPTATSVARGNYASLTPVLIALVIGPPILLFVLPVGSDVNVPRPVPLAGTQAKNWGGIQHLWDHKDPGALPDISDFLAHRAYQSAFLYHFPYELPARDEQVTIDNYDSSSGKFITKKTVVLTFTSRWLTDQLASPDQPARLLTAEPAAVQVRMEPAARFYTDYGMILRNSAVVLFVFSPFLLALFGLGVELWPGTRESITRRKRLAA